VPREAASRLGSQVSNNQEHIHLKKFKVFHHWQWFLTGQRALVQAWAVMALAMFLSIIGPGIAGARPDRPGPNKPVLGPQEESAAVHTAAPAKKPGKKPPPRRRGLDPRARWSEDWSTLWDTARLEDTPYPAVGKFWRPIKFIPLNEAGDIYLSLGGEFRLAYERYKDKDMGISDIGAQDALQLRLAAHADLHLGKKWRIFGQLGHGSVTDREGGEKAMDQTDIDIWQLFVDYRLPVGNQERVVFRLGRQLIETGGLFINAGEGNNVRQVYNAFRSGWIDDGFIKFSLLAAEYVDFGGGSFDMTGTGEYFWGFQSGMRWQKPATDLHFYYFGWHLKDRQFEQGGGLRHDELRHTLMLRLDRPLTGHRQWGLDYYLAYQFGEYDDRPGGSTTSAFAGFGEVRYALYPRVSTPIAGLKTAYFSGDHDPNDNELNTFYDPVFATPFFGYARDIQPYNLAFVQPNLGYRFDDRALLTLSHGFYWRANTNDAFYGNPNGITARAGVSDSAWLGQQTQLSLRYLLTPDTLVSAYLAYFFAGDVIQDAGGSDRGYVHIGIHYLF
jgi:alginate export protein